MKRILLVDDNEFVRGSLKAMLESFGDLYAVQTAVDGQEALEKIKAEDFDLIISDIEMPKMTGLGLLKIVKLEFPRLPVILIGGNIFEYKAEAISLGVSGCLQKPFRDETLKVLVEATLTTQIL